MDNTIGKKAAKAFLLLSALGATNAIFVTSAIAAGKMEKCYGIVKAGMNDCATAKASCAGSATQDKQADAFLFVPKGLCAKIVGGHLNPPSGENSKGKLK